ncbi:SagB family peptide dehydrogenase [Dactylosporangium sp. CA-092794]|uniref:SagB family peptide dehydrogenase n=1 Tax=Dactylosporangium sp. CA-092794 TaxID=3239929 RepID=UPI003D93D6AE
MPRPAPAVPDAAVVAPELQEAYRLRGDARLETTDDGTLQLRQSRFRLVLDRLSASRRAVMLRLTEGWLTDSAVGELVADIEGESRILSAQVLLRRLVAHAWLSRRLQVAARPLLEIRPRVLGPGTLGPVVRHESGVAYRVSRLATIHGGADGLVAYRPLNGASVCLLDPRVGGLLALAGTDGCDVAAAAAQLEVSGAAAGRVLDELLTAGVLVSPAALETEARQPAGYWAPQELALHDLSRPGWHSWPVGGTYRFRGSIDPEPLHRTFPGASAVDLAVPDLAAVAAAEPSLSALIAARRSIRRHDDTHPISVRQLGEFLYRVQHTVPTGEADGQEVGHRPYPSGGGIGELELYAVVNNCAGLAGGLYHYDAVTHRLESIPGPRPAADRVLGYARAAAAMPSAPQVLIVMTARVARLMWKYEGLSYAMMLKHAGILTELMYLVATSMALAPCAVGAGDGAAFAALSGLDPLAEPGVGDFLLGSRTAPS